MSTKTNLFGFIIAACVPALLHADTPYPEISAISRGLAEIMYSLADKESVDFVRLLETTWRDQKPTTSAR